MMKDEMASSARMRYLLILVLLSCTLSTVNSVGELGNDCDGPNRCIRATDCRRSITTQKKETIRGEERENNVLRNCGFDRLSLLVCCPPENSLPAHVDSHTHVTTTHATRSTTTYPPETRRTTVGQVYRETRPSQKPPVSFNTQKATTVAQRPSTQAPYSSNDNRRTQQPSTPQRPTRPPQLPFIDNNQNTQTSTQKPILIDRHTEASYFENSNTPSRTTETSYVEKVSSTTQRPSVVNRHTTSRPTVGTRPLQTTTKRWTYVQPTTPPAQEHYNSQNKENPQVPVRVAIPHEEEEFTILQSQQIGSSPSIYINSKVTAKPDRFSHQQTAEPQDVWGMNHKPVSTTTAHSIIFEEESYYGTQHRPVQQNRPEYPAEEHTSRPTRPTRPTTLPPTEPPYLPPRQPFEPPYIIDQPEGPPVENPQTTRPTSRPPNLSSTYPGANNVGSGESGPLWPSSQHVQHQQRPEERPVTSLPAKNDQDLTRHPNYRLIPQDICGTTAAGPNRIVNGQNVTLGQFPWMALLGYKTSDAAEDFVSVCGGTLINWKYVLTAAHCLKNSVRMVRLGEHVITTQPDCDQDGLCADPVVDIEIEMKIPHPSYGKPYLKNDLGLIRLRQAQPRLFSSYVRPICLPLEQEQQKPGRKLLVAGWGTTRRGSKIASDVLQMAVLPEIGNVECNDAQEDDILKPVVATQMCAAVNDRRSSSCHGDSGGPLMDIQQGRASLHRQFEGPVVVQLGIVSVGSDDCGLHGAPSIYTRVSSFTNWILDTLRD